MQLRYESNAGKLMRWRLSLTEEVAFSFESDHQVYVAEEIPDAVDVPGKRNTKMIAVGTSPQSIDPRVQEVNLPDQLTRHHCAS